MGLVIAATSDLTSAWTVSHVYFYRDPQTDQGSDLLAECCFQLLRWELISDLHLWLEVRSLLAATELSSSGRSSAVRTTPTRRSGGTLIWSGNSLQMTSPLKHLTVIPEQLWQIILPPSSNVQSNAIVSLTCLCECGCMLCEWVWGYGDKWEFYVFGSCCSGITWQERRRLKKTKQYLHYTAGSLSWQDTYGLTHSVVKSTICQSPLDGWWNPHRSFTVNVHTHTVCVTEPQLLLIPIRDFPWRHVRSLSGPSLYYCSQAFYNAWCQHTRLLFFCLRRRGGCQGSFP